MRRYPTNRYLGVNAHLNSYLLATFGSWSSFHAAFIAQLRQKLDIILPSNYYALSEQGFQLNFISDDDIEQSTSRPDILILESKPNPQASRESHTQAGISFSFPEIEEYRRQP